MNAVIAMQRAASTRGPFATNVPSEAQAGPAATEGSVSYPVERMRMAQILFDMLVDAHSSTEVRVNPIWKQEAIDRAYNFVLDAHESSEPTEAAPQIHLVRGLFEVAMPMLNDIVKRPVDHAKMARWLAIMKYEIDTAADDFE